jgi:hypothetical protein
VGDEDDVRQLATEILPELNGLLGRRTGAKVAAELRAALAEEGQGSVVRMRVALSRHERTRVWMRDRLRALAPRGEPTRGYSALPGLPPSDLGQRYVCPACAWTWFRPTADDPVPLCGRGHEPVRLLPVGG